MAKGKRLFLQKSLTHCCFIKTSLFSHLPSLVAGNLPKELFNICLFGKKIAYLGLALGSIFHIIKKKKKNLLLIRHAPSKDK